MPRSKYVNHKGKRRRFSTLEELKEEEEASTALVKWVDEVDGDAAGDAAGEAAGAGAVSQRVLKIASSSESDEDDEDDEVEEGGRNSRKGVAALIKIDNPNRTLKKATQKLSELSLDSEPPKPELSRHEREQIEKRKAQRRWEKQQARDGLTAEVQSDLARLAMIRQQRAAAAAKREAEKKALEQRKIARRRSYF